MMSHSTNKYIKIENSANNELIKIISLNRPEARNAFHPEMISEITNFFNYENKFENKIENKFENEKSEKKTTKLIILKAEGKVFCAGADLNWMKDMVNYSFAENTADSERLWEMFESIQNCQIPVVAVAHGAVFGGALGLLSTCDYVYAEENTKFCFSEVRLGLAPAIISGFISRKMPEAYYRPLMLSAEVFNTQEAQRIGLVQKIYSSHIETSEVAHNFLENGIEAMQETKKLLNLLQLQTARQSENNKKLCTKVISERRMSTEAQDRMKKFL